MGILRRIKDVANRQLRQGTQAKFYPRGLALPLDVFTDGKIRFGRKIGFPLGVIVPENRYRVAVDAIYGTDVVEIDRNPQWIEAGAFITIGQRELHEVEDVVEGEGTYVITLTTNLFADHLEGEYLYHYSNPITVVGDYATGEETLVVHSDWFMVRGDVIALASSAGDIYSFREYGVTDLVFVSLTGSIYEYQITLDKGLHRALVDGEITQLRAYPAYQSKILPVPTQIGPHHQVAGPFLIDWMSGPFLTEVEADETQTLQRYTKSRLKIGPPFTIDKNHLILHVPIRADQFLFWDRVNGDVNYDNTQHRFLALPDDNGNWRIKYTCVPNIEVPYTYPSGTLAFPDPSVLLDNDSFLLDDSVDAILFEYEATSSYVATPESAASGSITVAAPPPFPADNDSFTLDDGFGQVQVFEYEATSSFLLSDGAHYPIDIQSAINATDIVIATVNAVNAVMTNITATSASPSIDLVHSIVSQRGNQAIVLDANLTALGWTASGMSGGTDEVETIDVSAATSALDVAKLTSAAISRQRLQIRASFPTSFPAITLNNEIPGTAGNIAIVGNVADAGFIITGMGGGSGGTQWHFDITADQDVLLRVRLYPNDWQDYSLAANVNTTIVVDLEPTDAAVERIDLLIKSSGGGEIAMADWNISGTRVGALQHDYIARVQGEHNYGSSTILAKQIFQSLDDVQLQYDTGQHMDSGRMKL